MSAGRRRQVNAEPCPIFTNRSPHRRPLPVSDPGESSLMQTETNAPALQPIIEPWRILALVLIVAVAMLFVHAIEPATARISEQQAITASTDR